MTSRSRTRRGVAAVAACALALGSVACGADPASSRERAASGPGPRERVAPGVQRDRRAERFLDDLEHRTFRWFVDHAHPVTGLVPDRAPTPSFSSVAAVGFALTVYPIGVERGWIDRAEARVLTLRTLRFLADAPQGPEPTGVAGYKGFFYHFLDLETGTRFETVELSTIDTALLVAGALTARAYFVGQDADETEIRDLATFLAERVDWTWAQPNPPRVSHGWTPEDGFLAYDWSGYDEAMLLYVLALGSPTHAIAPQAWTAWTSTYVWAGFEGRDFVQFAPLFGHQYSHVWIDFRGIRDVYMRGRGIDYFENSRRAALSQHAYAVRNPDGWSGYGPSGWGLTACDGPADVTLDVGGVPRRFFTYAARGASATAVRDDGTLAPTAAGGSVPFVPELAIPALMTMRRVHGDDLYGPYGFVDAFNPTFTFTDVPLRHGRVVAGKGWYDTDSLGIDQGPIVTMIENYRTGLIWTLLRGDPDVVRGLRRAGFTGGWLDEAPI